MGSIYRVSGPVVIANNMENVKMYDVIKVGEAKLVGEVIKLSGTSAVIQVYEDTTGLRPGEPVENTNMPLSVMLAPGLIGSIFDGIQRPLDVIKAMEGNFIKKGESAAALDMKKTWHFVPIAKNGSKVDECSIIGEVKETDLVTHKIMVPYGKSGIISGLKEGDYTITDAIATLEGKNGKESIQMLQHWPVRKARPARRKLPPRVPLITGQRIIDTLFPIAKGGTAAIPGPFGSGKCISGDTPVYANGKKLPIIELYNKCKASGRVITNGNEEFVIADKPIKLYSFYNGGIRKSRAWVLYKGKSNALVEIETESGKTAKVTPVHKLFKINKGIIEEVPAMNLKPGDCIAGASDAELMRSDAYEIGLKLTHAVHGMPDARVYAEAEIQQEKEMHIVEEKIKSIKLHKGNFDVYDVSLPGYGRNFVGGNGALILHNTIIQHQLAKWSDADIIIYCGVGERGNEMAEVLTEFPNIKDPNSGKMLMDRTVFVANTSNMPVAAREASIYTSVTMAEYFRDMGYHVAVMADSTSRWAEAMREVSARLEEMPGEEGYPAYLPRRLAEFYERGGMVETANGLKGSVTIIGAVSPPGGDISEPISQNTLRVTRVFWALDASLASRRHFPAINWLNSYSLYADDLAEWFNENVSNEWESIRKEALELLQREAEINDIVQLVGYDALSEDEKEVLDIAKSIREDYLQQSAFDSVDTYTQPKKQFLMLKAIMLMHDEEKKAVERGIEVEAFRHIKAKELIARMKFEENAEKAFDGIKESLKEIEKLEAKSA